MHRQDVGKDGSSGFNLVSFNGRSSLRSAIVHFNVLCINMVKKKIMKSECRSLMINGQYLWVRGDGVIISCHLEREGSVHIDSWLAGPCEVPRVKT